MSIELAAPFEAPAAITLLPNPSFSDEEGSDAALNYSESMNGTPYTYIRRRTQRRLRFTFASIGRGKLLELLTFFQTYTASFIRLRTHTGEIWRVAIPLETLQVIHEALTKNKGGPRKESGSVSLEFVGERI
jgi:hypothetical protein